MDGHQGIAVWGINGPGHYVVSYLIPFGMPHSQDPAHSPLTNIAVFCKGNVRAEPNMNMDWAKI